MDDFGSMPFFLITGAAAGADRSACSALVGSEAFEPMRILLIGAPLTFGSSCRAMFNSDS